MNTSTPNDPTPKADSGAGAPSYYIASKTKYAAHWRQRRSDGARITSTWIDEAEEGQTSDYSELAFRCLREIQDADYLILYCGDIHSGDEQLKGALIEAGMALALGKRVRQVGTCNSISRVFCEHPLWSRHESIQAACDDAALDPAQGGHSSTQPESEVKSCAPVNKQDPTSIPSSSSFARGSTSTVASNAAPPQSDPAVAAAEWRLMETAPKDGTWIDIMVTGSGVVKRVSWEAGWWWSNDGCSYAHPTRWRPLPLAPAPAPEGRGETEVECPTCGGGGIISNGPRGERRYGGGRRCPTCVGSGKVTKPNASGATSETDAAVIHVRGMGTVVAAGKMAAMERERNEARAERDESQTYLNNYIMALRDIGTVLEIPGSAMPIQLPRFIGDSVQELKAQRDSAVAQAQALREAATALVERIKLIHDHPLYQSVWLCAHNHGVSYATGPTYEMELKALSAALAASEAGK